MGQRAKWSDLRFQLYDRNPQMFGAFEVSLDELHSIAFTYFQQKKYDLTRHALNEARLLLSEYLIIRHRSLRVPSSTMGLFFPSEIRFDPLLARQLEQLKAQGSRGIANSDQEFVKQVTGAISAVVQKSLEVQSYFREHGENPVTAFVSVYLWGVIRDSVSKGLDDVGLEGADYLRDLCQGLIQRRYFLNALTQIDYLEQLATLALLQMNDVILNVATRAMADCLMYNCVSEFSGSHITDHLLKSLFQVSAMRLNSPMGLDMNKVSYSIGPFISVTERSSLAARQRGDGERTRKKHTGPQLERVKSPKVFV